MAFVTPVVEHWLEREIAQWVHPMKDRSWYKRESLTIQAKKKEEKERQKKKERKKKERKSKDTSP